MPASPDADVTREEFVILAEFLNELDAAERELFGNAVNAAIVRNVKAAYLKGSQVGIRGLARVLDLQPSTVRRRVAQLVENGWLARDGDRVLYREEAMQRTRPLVQRVLRRFAATVDRLGWVNSRPLG